MRDETESEELNELIDELIAYFYPDPDVEYPSCAIYRGGTYLEGIVTDDLYRILTDLKEYREQEL